MIKEVENDMENQMKFVEFDKYCDKCAHKETNEWEEPCNECLSNIVNENSHKPVNFKEDE